MIVGHKRLRLDTSASQEIHKSSLKLGLASLKIVSHINSSPDLLHSRQESVLRRAVNKSAPFLHRSNRENGRWGNLAFVIFNRFHDSFVTAMQMLLNDCESFSIGSPENQDLIELIFFLEVSDIFSNCLQVLLLALAFDYVIGSLCLV